MQNFPTQPASPDIGLGIRNVSRSGNYDRPAREGRGDALFEIPAAAPATRTRRPAAPSPILRALDAASNIWMTGTSPARREPAMAGGIPNTRTTRRSKPRHVA